MKPFITPKMGATLWLVFLLLILFSGFTDKISELKFSEVKLNVEERNFAAKFFHEDSVRPTIKRFGPSIAVISQPQLKIAEGSYLLKLFAPGEFLTSDIIYTLLLLILCLIFLLKMRSIDFANPFSGKIIFLIKKAGIICFIFGGVDVIRMYIINKYVMKVTKDAYILKSDFIFFAPAFYAGLFLIILFRLLKMAEKLQIDRDLTI